MKQTRWEVFAMHRDDLEFLVSPEIIGLLPEGATFTQVNSSEKHPIGFIRFAEDVCTVWVGNLCGQGYTSMTHPVTGKTIRAHEWVAEQVYGPLQDGEHTHHECRNKACCDIRHIKRLSPLEHAQEHRIENEFHRLKRKRLKELNAGIER